MDIAHEFLQSLTLKPAQVEKKETEPEEKKEVDGDGASDGMDDGDGGWADFTEPVQNSSRPSERKDDFPEFK